ncbi:MAG: endonuclease/exonuclease/phosphatase family protein [Kofleriaceae bacterium]
MRYEPLLAALTLCAGCIDDEPELSVRESALTAPRSDVCNQGVGPQFCVQVPPFEVGPNDSRWTVDGIKGPQEYAGSVELPFVTDHATRGALALPALQVTGKVHVQRVTHVSTTMVRTPYLYVYLEDIPVQLVSGAAMSKVQIFVDADRWADDDGKPHPGDRMYTLDLQQSSIQLHVVATMHGVPFWTPSTLTSSTKYAPNGCVPASTIHALCRGELAFPLPPTGIDWTPLPSGLDPGIGFAVRTVDTTGAMPWRSDTYAGMPSNRLAWQTLLFARPKGFDVSFMSWNVRRFEKFIEGTGFISVNPKDIGRYLANNDVVAIQEGWDTEQVQQILEGANEQRHILKKKPFVRYGTADFESDRSSVIASIATSFGKYTHGGVWIFTALPVGGGGYHVYTDATCRGEDCWKAKGVQWLRVYMQELEYDPNCWKSPLGCDQPPSGDDFIDVFNTHLQASAPAGCTLEDLEGLDVLISKLLGAISPILRPAALLVSELINADMNCSAITDAQGRASQLVEMNGYIERTAATDRASILMGDFNVNGRSHDASEYREMLMYLDITTSPIDDRISVLGDGGFDLQHGDVLRERTDVLPDGYCTGTDIGETGGQYDPNCTFSGRVDGAGRLDFILVRPPVPRSEATDYPRWYVMENESRDVWASPFPSLTNHFAASPPARLSDHKPVRSSLTIARLSNPPPYNPTWRHSVKLRVTSYDAGGMEDCIGCGPVDPYAKLTTQILPNGSTSSVFRTSECTDNEAANTASCLANWARTRKHTPPNETSLQLDSKIWDDDDNGNGDDLIGFNVRSLWEYASARYSLTLDTWGDPIAGATALNLAAVPMALCGWGGGTNQCHQITLTPLGPGE